MSRTLNALNTIKRKERPIFFTGEMVRAILDGRKTQTRRIMKPQPFFGQCPCFNEEKYINATPKYRAENWTRKSRYGKRGDHLWVRETIGYECEVGESKITVEPGETNVFYAATEDWEGPRIASIHMPRWASRITLEIINIGIERIQDITPEGVRAEGVITIHPEVFPMLWNSIHGRGAWDLNPWVWLIEFKRI